MMNPSRIRAPLALKRYGQTAARCQQRRSASSTKETKTTGSGAKSSWFGRMWEGYTEALFARPLAVKAGTASIIFFASDSGTQYLMDPNAKWDPARSGSGAAFGVVATSWLHYWWGFLEGFVGKRLPVATHRWSNTLVKVFLDQAIGAPIYIYTYYIITNFLQELNSQPKENGKSSSVLFKETRDRATEMLPPTMMRHWTLWPAVHTFNFYYNPLHHRVLVQNLVLVGWSGYLSHLNNGGLMTPKEEVDETIKKLSLQQRTTTHSEITIKRPEPIATISSKEQ